MFNINFIQIASAFVILFAVIDVLGSIPIFLSIKDKHSKIKAFEASMVSLVIFLLFFYAGDALLNLFRIDVASFAVAGSFVIFILSIEMVLGIEIMKNESSNTGATIVPIAFPLIAGPGALTTLLSIRAEYATINIILALVLNLIFAFIVLKFIDKIEKVLGASAIFILRKFFGVILLAIAVKLFTSNISVVIANI